LLGTPACLEFGPRVGDHLDLRHQLHRREQAPLPVPVRLVSGRLLEHVHRARRERVIDLEQFTTVERCGNDQDRRRLMCHDILGSGQAAHHRHHHVHGYDVWPISHAQFDRLLAVLGFADHINGRIGRQRLDQPPADRCGILDHKNPGLRHVLRGHHWFDHGKQLRLIELAFFDVALRTDVSAAFAMFGRGQRRYQDGRDMM